MCITTQQLKDFISHNRLTKKTEEFAINLYFLIKGLKPSILWDFGKMNTDKLRCLGRLLGRDFLILEVANNDYFICLKTRLITTLKNSLLDPPLYVDVSEALEVPSEATSKVADLLAVMVKSVIEQIDTNISDNLLCISVEDHWNISSLFGILLGFPVVYYYDINAGNCLGNLDLTVWSVGCGQLCPISFSAPAFMEGLAMDRVVRWWTNMEGNNQWGVNCDIGELSIASKKSVVNMPVVVL